MMENLRQNLKTSDLSNQEVKGIMAYSVTGPPPKSLTEALLKNTKTKHPGGKKNLRKLKKKKDAVRKSLNVL